MGNTDNKTTLVKPYPQTPENIDKARENLDLLKFRLLQTRVSGFTVIKDVESNFKANNSESFTLDLMKEIFGLAFSGLGMIMPGFDIMGSIFTEVIEFGVEAAKEESKSEDPSLPDTFLSLEIGFDKIFLQADAYLSELVSQCNETPEGFWEKPFKSNKNKAHYFYELVDLIDMDGKTGTKMMKKSFEFIRFYSWKYLLCNLYEVRWAYQEDTDGNIVLRATKFMENATDQSMMTFAKNHVDRFSNNLVNWKQVSANDSPTDKPGCLVKILVLKAKNAALGGIGDPSRAFCDAIFQDDGGGNIVNEKAITNRSAVFIQWPNDSGNWKMHVKEFSNFV